MTFANSKNFRIFAVEFSGGVGLCSIARPHKAANRLSNEID